MDFSKIKPLNVNIRKTAANGKVYEMIDYDEYCNNIELYTSRNDVAITLETIPEEVIPEDLKGKNLILPLKVMQTANPISPGVYEAGPLDFYIYPDEASIDKFVPERIVRIDNAMDAKEIIESSEAIRRLDEPFITTPDHITKIPIGVDDQPEMRCLKEALNEKSIDIDKYAGRFGDNFPNDKRQLKNTSATLNIIKRFCNNMDIEAMLVLKDKNPDVPNPIGKEIVVSLTNEELSDEVDD